LSIKRRSLGLLLADGQLLRNMLICRLSVVWSVPPGFFDPAETRFAHMLSWIDIYEAFPD